MQLQEHFKDFCNAQWNGTELKRELTLTFCVESINTTECAKLTRFQFKSYLLSLIHFLNIAFNPVTMTICKQLHPHYTKTKVVQNLIGNHWELSWTNRFHVQVPIIKFRDEERGIDGDLSLYNRLAVQNTALLRRYSEVDRRVRTLGLCVKLFAKVYSLELHRF